VLTPVNTSITQVFRFPARNTRNAAEHYIVVLLSIARH